MFDARLDQARGLGELESSLRAVGQWASSRSAEFAGAAVKFFELSLHGQGVWVRRTQHPSVDVAAFADDFAALNRELERISARSGTPRILVGLRETRGRNDAEFEAAIAPHRRRLFESGDAMGVLMKTQVVAMQIRRHFRTDGVDALVFEDEAEAERWLREG